MCVSVCVCVCVCVHVCMHLSHVCKFKWVILHALILYVSNVCSVRWKLVLQDQLSGFLNKAKIAEVGKKKVR